MSGRQGGEETPAGQPSPPRPKLQKVSLYLRPEDILRLEEIRVARLRTGQRVDKSALVREAIGLLPETTG